LDETGATIISVSFAASGARRRRVPTNNSGKAKAIVELEIPIEEDDELEGIALEDIGKVVIENVLVKINQQIKQGKFGRLDQNTEAGAIAKEIRQPKPRGIFPVVDKDSVRTTEHSAERTTAGAFERSARTVAGEAVNTPSPRARSEDFNARDNEESAGEGQVVGDPADSHATETTIQFIILLLNTVLLFA